MDPMTATWLEALRARADRPPERPREPLCLAGATVTIGSIEPGLGERLVAAGLPLARVGGRWQLRAADADAALDAIARWLHAQGLGGRWRGELLAVTDADGARRGAVERAAVRPLGIATYAVHLVGWTRAGELWVQQRALDKATDPGLWDTLMGGLVAGDESTRETLVRETDEEAGLEVGALEDVAHADRLVIRRPVHDGYMVEHIEVFEAVVPDKVEPRNRDGEVERFERLGPNTVVERLRADAFTLEAALILAAALERRGLL
jgi:8-oxo-dGTP pyrophosphatase MutT (NUDIX family)